ncbi:adenosylcobinamide-GDP ribazoletransferase [Roseofilum sp. BLCC_M154]|uniref:Adenosylcobinamide-GDP ribazoletransferase n=1 Tax=Roseofilum acuticapitatum BLCC-M154 TaxID=3022444 RepID=A0ABT7AUZ7_9CYAN|nr:adenosylcobinamide-GDP ribazoletransferase [Roseofilum acuticapitatum]MDJ1170711.1 adenosylcobinamide-GDP ribazoletransferase [Roseofilum acuticapitatum BLCC-M154]
MKCIWNFWGAIAFYTRIPIPGSWPLEFSGIARLAAWVGLLIGAILAVMNWGLWVVGMPNLTRSSVIVALWVGITGGLHLDGAMDTADGLSVTDGDRRLQVMSDSVTGAFGVMSGILILLLKTATLSSLEPHHLWIVLAIPAWARAGQLMAIWRYPYLKPTGKGAFHKAAIQSYQDVLPTVLMLITFSAVQWALNAQQGIQILSLTLGWGAIAWGTGWWFNRQLGGHTGDTYGAVVEWTEAWGLVWAILIESS